MEPNNSSALPSEDAKPVILIVDDEELMREVTAIMIEENGYDVLLAKDGEDGLKTLESNNEKVSLVLIDFSMPKMDGYEAFVEMRKLNPAVPVIMMSGLRAIPEINNLVQQKELAFISKPFHESALIKVIEETLNGDGDQGKL